MLYTGQAHRLMLPPLAFVQATKIADRNLIAFRDLHQQLYQRGISQEIATMTAFLRHQQAERDKLNWVRDTYCVGSSGGAYAAIVSGHVLKAKAVYAFAPPSVVPEEFLAETTQYLDLVELLREHNGVTRYRVFYNEAEAPDREAALRLEGLPGVELFAEEGTGHGVVVTLANSGKLDGLLPPFEAAEPRVTAG
jgi:hypothetical protein